MSVFHSVPGVPCAKNGTLKRLAKYFARAYIKFYLLLQVI